MESASLLFPNNNRRNKFEFVEVVAAAGKRTKIRDGHGAHLRHIRSCVESERSVPFLKLKKERDDSFIRSTTNCLSHQSFKS